MRHQPEEVNLVSDYSCSDARTKRMAVKLLKWREQVEELTKMTALVIPWASPLTLGLWGTCRDDMLAQLE